MSSNPLRLARLLLVSACAILVSACAHSGSLQSSVTALENRIGGQVGLAVLDTGTQEIIAFNGHARFPLMSTFKTLACAKLLSDAENGRQTLDASVVLQPTDLVTYSPVTEKFVGKPLRLDEACSAAMLTSDNTAANVVLGGIGGPQGVTDFARTLGDLVTRLDRREPELNSALTDDPRDTTTPQAMVLDLHELLFGSVLAEASKARLRQWMSDNQVANPLLRSVLPPGWRIADRSGAGGNGSRGITAIVWPPNHPPLIIAIYLTGTRADMDTLNKAIAGLGTEIFGFYQSSSGETPAAAATGSPTPAPRRQ